MPLTTPYKINNNFFLFKNIYSFIWLHLVLAAAWGIFDLSRSMWELDPTSDLGLNWPGIEPGSSEWEVWSPSYWTTSEVPQ